MFYPPCENQPAREEVYNKEHMETDVIRYVSKCSLKTRDIQPPFVLGLVHLSPSYHTLLRIYFPRTHAIQIQIQSITTNRLNTPW